MRFCDTKESERDHEDSTDFVSRNLFLGERVERRGKPPEKESVEESVGYESVEKESVE